MTGPEIYLLFEQYPRICTDTRKLQKGDLFFALKGEKFDGNAYAAQALEKGAAYAIVDDLQFANTDDERYVWVKDSLKALQDLALRYRKSFSIPVIGITGSNGKTTSKELLRAVLAQEKQVYATQGNFNNHIGVPLTLLAMPRDTEIAIIEMGTNQPGDIAELVDMALPTHALITNIGSAHLERLGSIAGIREEKGALFRKVMKANGRIFLNKADEELKKLVHGYAHISSFGTVDADYAYDILRHEATGMEIQVSSKHWEEAQTFSINLTGQYNALNALAAISIGEFMGISLEAIREGLRTYVSTNNRSQLIVRNGYRIFLDAYNANPSSMKAAISNVFELQAAGTSLILGDMFELGPEAASFHKAMGDHINLYTPKVCIGIGPLMKHMIAQIQGPKYWFPDAASCKDRIASLVEGSEMILIKASRSMALETLLDEL